ncbi:hypothetical protein CLOM_g21089 [Closterium sp. NIES-68]|nr:hypothetical protein CLOM_g21089 [Closterium sp. NIES-68]GJP61597.1 hypothetical protein CLOP_g18740 [Closterium sp. NIES-67]
MSCIRFSRSLAIVLALAFALPRRRDAADAYSLKEECVRRWTEEAARQDPSRRYAFVEADGVNRDELTDWPKRLTCYHMYLGKNDSYEYTCEKKSCDADDCLVLEDHNVWEAAHMLIDRANGEDTQSTWYGSNEMCLDVTVSIKGDDTRAGFHDLLFLVQEASIQDEGKRFVRQLPAQEEYKRRFCYQFGCLEEICYVDIKYDLVSGARLEAFDLEYEEGAAVDGDDTDRAWPARARYRDALFRESTLAELKLRVRVPENDDTLCDALGIALVVGQALPGANILALGSIGLEIAC